MPKEFQSELAELEKLKGISIVTSDSQRLVLGLSYKPRKAFAWMFWATMAILYGAGALLIWWVAVRA